KLRGGLDLRLAHAMTRGGDTGPALVPGKPAESLVLQRIRAGEMPPGKTTLAQEHIALIERWIAAGARAAGPGPKGLPLGFSLSQEEAAFWAWQPIRRPALPKLKSQHLVRTGVDAFLLAKLEEKGESFSPEAEPAVLLRRVYFDLIGLPPTPEEVDRFI